MAKLYTKTGDQGRTSLLNGSRVPKNHPRVCAYGAVDELNALLGLCRSACPDHALQAKLEKTQKDLFLLGAELATPQAKDLPDSGPVRPDQIQRLETWIDQAAAVTPPLRSFILPAGCELACRLHHARTACRAAERRTVTLAKTETLNPQAIVYLNRLGDLLFAWARQANHDAGAPETTWPPPVH